MASLRPQQPRIVDNTERGCERKGSSSDYLGRLYKGEDVRTIARGVNLSQQRTRPQFAGLLGSSLPCHPGDKGGWIPEDPCRRSHVVVGTLAAKTQEDAEAGCLSIWGITRTALFLAVLLGKSREHKWPLRRSRKDEA